MAYDLRTLGIDIRDLFREGSGLTPRYVLMLVGQLPETSALAASLRGGREMRSWTTDTYLLAATANQLWVANNQRAGRRTRKPLIEPPKPAKQKARRRTVTVAQLLEYQRQSRGSRPPN